MIGPGSANPMLWGSADPLDDIAKIERSLRLRSSVGGGLTRTPPASNRLKWTFSSWVKASAIGQVGVLIGATITAGASEETLRLSASGQLEFNDGAVGLLAASVASFRDPSSHAHVMAVYDSANTTPADRFILYWNGVRLATTGTISASRNSYINAATAHGVGRPGSIVATSLDGYLSHVSFIDGKALSPSDFGQFHPRTGQWRPRSKAAIRAAVAAGGGSRNGWGVNGFFLPFDDFTSLTTLGYDRSQTDAETSGNNFSTTNISLTVGVTYDSMLDTPTNNFANLNPLSKTGAAAISGYSPLNGNLAFSWSHGGSEVGLFRLSLDPKHATYFEVIPSAQSLPAGATSVFIVLKYLANRVDILNSVGGLIIQHNGSSVSTTAIVADNSVLGVRISDSGQIEIYVNGTLLYSSTLLGGLPEVSIGAGTYSSGTFSVNFGQRPFVYAPPSGFKALCTKNLPVRQPVMRGDSAFAAVTDSGSSVAISLAAKAPWADWIRIYKRRDASEGWRWQFSDDQGNYLDSSGTAAKAAMPALAGTSYVGYAMKLSPANGIASGRLVHVNGVADVVIDGLAKARKLVILKSEATGNWVVFHPDLTAGKLLYLNSVAAETTDATISAVTATGFTVAAALPSGTYRWIAMSEVDGFLSLGKYVGNGSVDGPFNSANSPAFTLTHVSIGGTSGWGVIDAARDTWNPSGTCSSFESASAEVAGTNYLDHLANGFKLRQSAYNANSSGQTQIFMSIAKFPFRYANAR